MIALKSRQRHVILAVTFGSILEWYDVYSYVYLAPVLGKLFFNLGSFESNLFMAFLFFAIGSLTRPTGGLIFGRWGDLKGRKSPFVWSIFITTVATFLIGCLPSYSDWGIWAAISLIALRIIQSAPQSGEYVGAACFLYENANLENRRFMTSLVAVGNQIGAIIAIFQSLILDRWMSEKFLYVWGWRLSFWIGGAIGLFGFILRRTLDETPIFKEIKARAEIDRENACELISARKSSILKGTAFGIINGTSFYLIAAYLPTYWEIHGLSNLTNAIISISILVFTTILLPVFGLLNSFIRSKTVLIGSVIWILCLLPIMYFSIQTDRFWLTVVLTYLYIIPIAGITAILPSVILQLFKAPVRATGVGIVFNLSDGVVGSFTPAIAILLSEYTHDQGAFCWYLLVCALVSLYSYIKLKD